MTNQDVKDILVNSIYYMNFFDGDIPDNKTLNEIKKAILKQNTIFDLLKMQNEEEDEQREVNKEEGNDVDDVYAEFVISDGMLQISSTYGDWIELESIEHDYDGTIYFRIEKKEIK